MAMKKRSRSLEIFSVSFLDVISCGFGAITLLVLLSKTAAVGGVESVERIAGLLKELSREEATDAGLQADSEQLSAALAESLRQKRRLQTEIEHSEKALAALQIQGERLAAKAAGLKDQLAPPTVATSADATDEKDLSVGGIPVGADYVVFIVDTSGSMKSIWDRVIRELDNVLDIHPEVRGFQVLSDMGEHLISAYQGKWIPDTAGRRKSALKLLRSWNAFSNSSPVEGLEKALRLYAKARQKTSIYIFGDEYATGLSYDVVLKTIAASNTDKITNKPVARIHGIGFSHHQYLETSERFATLMREVARQSRGAFIALD